MNTAAEIHMKTGRCIAILFRKDEKPRSVEGYAIHGMIKYWQRRGITVLFLFGPPPKKVAADLLFVHVNLSVVPQGYREYAKQYSVALNSHIIDIRKSTVCENLLLKDDSYQGPVIVKSNLNAAGLPEKKAQHKMVRQMKSLLDRLMPPALLIERQEDYRIFPSINAVPPGVFIDDRLVIQKFLPETDGDVYYARSYHFLGDRYSCVRLSSPDPLIYLRNTNSVEAVEPHPDIIAIRQKLKMDYGKLDYTIHNGRVVLLDVNKTTGVRRNENDPAVLAMRKERAKGIFPYLGMETPSD